MPTQRLSMRRIKEVLRLKHVQGLPERAIARTLGISNGAVHSYLRRAGAAGLNWPLPAGMTDEDLELLLFTASAGAGCSRSSEFGAHDRAKSLLTISEICKEAPLFVPVAFRKSADGPATLVREQLRHDATRAVRPPLGEARSGTLLLTIEDIEQAVAANEATEDKKDPARARKRADKRRADRGALPAHLPHIDVTIAPEDTNCPCCRAPMHVIGEETSKRLDVVPAQFRVIVTHRPKYACRGLHGWRGSGTGARAADQGWAADRGDGRLCAGRQICLASAALSAGSDAACAGHRHQARGACVLGRLCGRGASSSLAAAARDHPDRGQDRGRRNHGTGAGSRSRPHQEGLLLGDRARRSAVGQGRPAGSGLHLCPRSWRGPRAQAARRLSRHRAMLVDRI
ncbi:transposase [Bradyrhizobium sp. USDA 4515]